MKKQFFGTLMAVVLLTACQMQPAGFTLKGKLTGEADKALIVNVVDKDGLSAIDTLTLVDGVVDFQTTLDQPMLIVIQLEGARGGLTFFGENVAYTIDGDINALADAVVTGGELFNANKTLDDLQKEINNKGEELRVAYGAASQAGDTARQSEIVKEFEAGQKQLEDAQIKFVDENPTSPISAFIVSNVYRHKPLEEIKEGVAKLDASLSTSPYYQVISERVAKLEKVAIGQPAPDFTMNDADGNPVSLSSFKGKLILVDFWASWCGPCRRENPNVVKLYAEFKDKGFDILGVSLDQKKDAWLKAIEDDQLTWNHVSDLKGWGNDAAKLYAVSGIPHTVLIDAEGVIIAKNLRGDELHNKVAELLN
ncbi:redoxin domain-containing protein [Carboxylicivirga sp. N1Y90]|uniref:redoxin domain-containing protein n=1 Tax=Carboxylicivirga fragile TaxID=3417571 RepID=UPI003D331368|nr:AhpC/TSA family protein [Marinilabiliaceae bacterium N1Y90]